MRLENHQRGEQEALPTPPEDQQSEGLLRTSPKSYPLPPDVPMKVIQPQDFETPDSHVERDPRLIRLTGVHPLNCEAPLTALYDEGFLTSENLHYVRSHGHVPRCEDDDILDWTFAVDGMVRHPITLTVRDLIETFDQKTYPITLVCAGNRRKEQNMVRKSKGFSWGPAGLSTALWTGVTIGDLLARAQPLRGARYVCFEGADSLPNGYYGTSVKLNWCMDPNRGIMVAHKMNGRVLHPDHGKPVRIVIPGQIGGRSVKWLKKITVTKEPSDNWYHVYDNRVLPTMITPEASGDLPDVWKDEKYAIYDLNANSAICHPQHDERLALGRDLEQNRVYKARGYAYGGGGRRITRAELTLDQGKTWRLATLSYPEDSYRDAPEGDSLYGGAMDMGWRETSFCWCFWELDIPVSDLEKSRDIIIRTMDEGLMVQPRDMYWNVLGMMNNPWFRVVIHKEGDGVLRFEHPTQPALMPGGWMERIKKAGGDLSNGAWGEKTLEGDADTAPDNETKEISKINPKIDRLITMAELKDHSNKEEPWFVVEGQVYDGTAYLKSHPGGPTSIIAAAGQDCTDEFMAIHSENALNIVRDFHIGTLDQASQLDLAHEQAQPSPDDTDRSIFLQSKTWNKIPLESKAEVSHDSKIFTFALHHDKQQLGLPTGQHILMRLQDPSSKESITRAYTPISYGNARGKIKVLVKIYHSKPTQKGGKMTQALDRLSTGHFVDFKGPLGKFEYLGNGFCDVAGEKRRVKRFVMICGGSGITPIFQVLRAVAEAQDDATTCLLLDGNRQEQDILCRRELEELSMKAQGRIWTVHSLSQPNDSWSGRRGRMDKEFFTEKVGPAPQGEKKHDAMILVCGPKQLEEEVNKIMPSLGWEEDDILFF